MRILALFLLICFSAVASPATPAGAHYRYRSVAIVGGGFITGLVAHPAQAGLRYARTDIGGAYRWDSAGKQWVPLLDWLPFSDRNLLGVESLAVDPTDPHKLYLAAGTYTNARTPDGAILRSSDQGRHFEIVRVPFKMGANELGRSAGERLQVDPNRPQTLFLGTRLDGLWRSTDAGVTWNRLRRFPALPLNNIGVTFVAFDKTSGHAGMPTPVLLAGVADPVINLLRSDDGGESWKPVVGGPMGMFPNHGVFSSDGTLYLSYGNGPGPNGITDGAVWAYTPRTGAWRDITPEKPGSGAKQNRFGYGVVAVDAADPHLLLASTMDRWNPGDTLFRSTDAGAHWRSLKEGAVREASLSPYLKHGKPEAPFGHWLGAAMTDPADPAHVLYGTGETIWESTDAAATGTTHWSVGARGIEEAADLALLSPSYPGSAGPHLFTGVADIGCFRNDEFVHSPPGGAMANPELSDCDAIALAANAPEQMVRVGRNWDPHGAHGAVSHDGGLHWTPFATEPKGGENGGDAAISADGKALLWAIHDGPLAISQDAGAHWRDIPVDAKERSPLQVLADQRSPESFWVYNRAAGVLSRVDGNKAELAGRAAVPKEGKLAIAPEAPAVLWITSEHGLFRSEDAGAHWKPLPSVVAAYALGFGKAAPGANTPVLFIAGALTGTPEAAPPKPGQSLGGGIYRSLDGGASWQRIDDSEHQYGWIEQIAGDPRIFGRVYLGTNGRGVLFGDPEK